MKRALRNFCVEPSTETCTCTRLRCGGIDENNPLCPEHGSAVPVADIVRTHAHEVRGLPVGTLIA